ncbi:heavy metal translocating P-type ATPase [Hydrogenoanaerobacterium sp.]|uniref:heavy metal translocating P-type ATPase n=1 Tax=Hydrogenoanaerobacterium sp. TaxID=2953763 RepID=UPI00289931DC|nr:heavy metal translocating P-type ATPase [Hydrogenoanaerobacterium sp.]
MKKTFYLEGLDCANCAAKLERAVGALDMVQNVTVDFMTKKLIIEAADDQFDAALEKAKAVITKIEPDVTVTMAKKARKSKGVAHHSHAHAHGHGHDDCEGGCCGCDDEHNHADEHDEDEEEDDDHNHADAGDGYLRTQIIRIIGTGIILATAMLMPDMTLLTEFLMFLIAYLFIGADILWKAIKNIFRGKVFDENFLMSIATVGAFCIGEYPEGVAVMLFYQIGELFQHYAVNRSRKSIAGLMDIRPDYANVLVNGELIKGSPEDVEVGDIIVVKAGEKIPLDGKVIEGASTIDTSALTGESLPREAEAGSEVLSGCINLTGVLNIEVTKEFGESTVSKILDLVENASSKKANAENFITKFAKYYTPIVVGIAVVLAVAPPLLFGGVWNDWIYRALSFLVVSCPCALVISIPLGFFGGIGGASKCGVLIKGSNYLEALADTEMVVFDKTGTLTKGRFAVTELYPQGVSDNELLELTAYAEAYSNHPISLSIKAAYGKAIDNSRVADVEETAGQGVKAVIDGKTVLAGNARLMDTHQITYQAVDAIGTVVHVAADGVYRGCIVIADQIKPDAKHAIAALKAGGVKKTVMLTGDAKAVGEAVAKELGLDEAYTELLPADKVEQMEKLLTQKTGKGKLAFVGDGINDAPVLARADIGIAMGGLGSDAAIEAADIVIMTDEPSRIATAMKISRKTLRIVKQNIVFALVVKVLVLVLVAFGMSTMWEAVFADVGVSVIAILNSMRALRVKKLK